MVTGYVRAGITSETKIQYSSVTEIFSFKSVQDSLLRLVWIVLRPVRVYQKVVSSGTEERETQCQGNIQLELGISSSLQAGQGWITGAPPVTP